MDKDVVTTEPAGEQTIDVLEGIKVLREDVENLLSDNPYLKKIT